MVMIAKFQLYSFLPLSPESPSSWLIIFPIMHQNVYYAHGKAVDAYKSWKILILTFSRALSSVNIFQKITDCTA